MKTETCLNVERKKSLRKREDTAKRNIAKEGIIKFVRFLESLGSRSIRQSIYIHREV